MVLEIGRWIAIGAGAALAAVGLLMMTRPRGALTALGRMGSTPRIHFGEMALRAFAGAGIAVASPASRYPQALLVVGLFLVGSSAVLVLLPRRWHAGYSSWWAARIPPLAVRLFALVGIAAGAALAYVVV